MNPLKFVQGLSPVLDRRQVVSEIKQVRDELTDNTMPELRQFQELFTTAGSNTKPVPLDSKWVKQFERGLSRHMRFRGTSWVDAWVDTLEKTQFHLGDLEDLVRKEFGSEIPRSGMSFEKVTLLQVIEMMGFFVTYSRKLMLRITGEESTVQSKATKYTPSRGERELVDEQLDTFYLVFATLYQQKDLKTTLTKLSDALIDEDTYEVARQSIPHNKQEALRVGMFSPSNNPFFIAGKWFAEWQVKRYQAAKEERQALQLRYQELRELAEDGNVNPKLQQHITHTENRIESLNYKIQKIYDDNALG